MQKLARFWKKDFINKAIVLAICLIVAALIVDLIMLLMPKSSGSSLLNDLFPTPTLEMKVIMTNNAATASYEAAMATASVPPTMTTMPFATFTPLIKSPSPTQALTTPTPAVLASAATQSPNLTQTLSITSGMACIPGNPRQYGKVLEIIDGYTIKVLMNDLVYQVRYIGVKAPEEVNLAQLATAKNGELVYLKEITLISDGADKDQYGRLRRYVIVEDTFVNLELVQQGYAYADDAALFSSCAQVFKDAEQSAKTAQRGIWKFAPSDPAP